MNIVYRIRESVTDTAAARFWVETQTMDMEWSPVGEPRTEAAAHSKLIQLARVDDCVTFITNSVATPQDNGADIIHALGVRL